MQPASKSVAVFANSSLDAKHSPTVQTNTRATPRQTLQIQLKTPSPLPVTVDRHHHHQGTYQSVLASLRHVQEATTAPWVPAAAASTGSICARPIELLASTGQKIMKAAQA